MIPFILALDLFDLRLDFLHLLAVDHDPLLRYEYDEADDDRHEDDGDSEAVVRQYADDEHEEIIDGSIEEGRKECIREALL